MQSDEVHGLELLSLFSTSAMAQSRMMSICVKKQKLEEDILDMQKDIIDLARVIKLMKVIPGGNKARRDVSRNEVSPEHVQFLLQTSLSIDNIILKIQNLLNRCSNHSFFLQRQLELKTCQI